MFDTWGPYTCRTHDAAGIDALWEEFRADITTRVEDGVGVYVIGVEAPDGGLMPWYVGQTYRSFGDRLKRHFKNERFGSLSDKGPLKIILIARAKDGQIVPRQTGSREKLDRKFIDWLEVNLIDKCRLVNSGLLNRQFVRFLANIWVGGYTGEGALAPKALEDYPAYRALANMLRHTEHLRKKVEAADVPTRKTLRGKYTNLLRQGTNVAILDPDVVDHFPDSESVNNALRAFLAFGKQFESVVSPKNRQPKGVAEQGHELVFDPRTGGNHKVLAAK